MITRPLTPVTRVRTPLGSPSNKNRDLGAILSPCFILEFFKSPVSPPMYDENRGKIDNFDSYKKN